jgi:hypothetical protein
MSIDQTRNQNLAGAIDHFVLSDAVDLPDLLDPPIVDSGRAVVKDSALRILCYNPLTVLQKQADRSTLLFDCGMAALQLFLGNLQSVHQLGD